MTPPPGGLPPRQFAELCPLLFRRLSVMLFSGLFLALCCLQFCPVSGFLPCRLLRRLYVLPSGRLFYGLLCTLPSELQSVLHSSRFRKLLSRLFGGQRSGLPLVGRRTLRAIRGDVFNIGAPIGPWFEGRPTSEVRRQSAEGRSLVED